MRAGSIVGWLLLVSAASGGGCSSGSSAGSGAASCSNPGPTQGTGWNLGKSPVDPGAAARAAVLLASCIPDDSPMSRLKGFYYNRSVDDLYQLDMAACLGSKSNGCQSVTECTGISVTIGSACTPGCNGDIVEICDGGEKIVADCARLGARCVPGEGCVACNAGPSCSTSSFDERCDDGRPVSCDHGHEQPHLRCADLGLVCAAEPSSDPSFATITHCFGPGAPCSAGNGTGLAAFGCTGNQLAACVGGNSFDIDCSEVGAGFTCQKFDGANGPSVFCGIGSECDATASEQPTCDGSSVNVCNAGKLEKIDCLALGFTGCEPKSGRCVPGPYAGL